MNFVRERTELCEAGRRLAREGLVARTWGNLSIRVSAESFLVSPSGRTYDSVEPADIALVLLADLSWSGPLKPSSEKDLHARIYRLRPEVRAIVHTHQPAASSLAAARRGFVPVAERDRERLGPEVPCVPYALPTTKALAKAVEKVVSASSFRALLLSNHGAVCLGSDMTGAIAAALTLESACSDYVLDRFRRVTGSDAGGVSALLDHYVQSGGRPASTGGRPR